MSFRKKDNMQNDKMEKKHRKYSERREWDPEEIKRKQNEFAAWYARRMRFSRMLFKLNEIIWAVVWSTVSIKCLYENNPLPVFLSAPAAAGFWVLLIKPTRFAVWMKRQMINLKEKWIRLIKQIEDRLPPD